MTVLGMFGKMPSFGDFVSMGSGSPLHRGFERWLEDSNDVLATRNKELSKNPLGLMIRGEDPTAMLVGILVGSCDSVGRTFPLGLFHEVRRTGVCPPGLPMAMASDLNRLAGVARKARSRGHHEIETLLRNTQIPSDNQLAVRSHAELHRLRIVQASLLLERVFGTGDTVFYGVEVIERACALAEERGSRAPLVIDGQARTDVELMFLLATVDAMTDGRQPVSVVWDVSSRRVLFVLGYPDAGLLALIMAEAASVDRLWPLSTDRPELGRRAAEGLDARLRAVLDEVGSSSAKDFLAAMATACKSRQSRAVIGKESRSLWRSKVP